MAGSKKITIAHVAEHANVSSATVSRVLRHPELVNPSTVARVRKSLSELGYSGIAGQPAAGTSRRTIVVNIPWLDNPFYGEIMRGVRVSAEAHGLEMLISWGSPDNVESCKRFCSMLQNCGAAGVIILCPLSAESLERISNTVPTVQCCEYNPETNIPFVSIDDREAARTAVEHLVSCGCKKLSIVCGPQVYKYARGRKEGFLEVIRAHDKPEIAQRLELSDDELLHYFIRLRTGNGKPIAISYNYVSTKIVPAIDVKCLEQSFYAFLDSQGIEREYQGTSYTAKLPTAEQQELLEANDIALLCASHSTFTRREGKLVPFGYTLTCYNGNLYTYYSSI